MKKNFALAVALTIALSSTAPAFAFTRDGGGGWDRDWHPLDRIIHLIKKLITPGPNEEIGIPHP
jgi:hypothetical protein